MLEIAVVPRPWISPGEPGDASRRARDLQIDGRDEAVEQITDDLILEEARLDDPWRLEESERVALDPAETGPTTGIGSGEVDLELPVPTSWRVPLPPPRQLRLPKATSKHTTTYAIINPSRQLRTPPDRTVPDAVRPFWLRRSGGAVIGPLNLSRLGGAVRAERQVGSRVGFEVSTDQSSWMPWAEFLRLTQQDGLDASGELPAGSIAGSLRTLSLVALFRRISERAPTGKLILLSLDDRFRRTELHVVRGQPTYVAVSDPEAELPAQLVRHRVLSEEVVERCMYLALQERRPVRDVIQDVAALDLDRFTRRFMSERLMLALAPLSGTFAFLVATPEHVVPFAPSLLSLVPRLLPRARSPEQLRTLLTPMMRFPLERTPIFGRLLTDLRLDEEQQRALAPLGHGATLTEALRNADAGDRWILPLAYLLLDLGGLVPGEG